MQFEEEKELTEELLPEQQNTSTENTREEFVDENSEEEPQKKSWQNKYQDKYKKIRDEYREEQNRFQSERNKLLEELEKRNQEIETWKSYANQSINASAFHYHTSAEQRLKAAEERLDMARRDGDFQAEKLAIKEMVDAQTDIREARKIRNDIDSYNSNNNYEGQNQQKYNSITQNQASTNTQDSYSPDVEYRAAKWVERNPEVNPQSPHYNQKTEGAIRKAAEDLTNYFYQNGRPDLVGSVQYFNYLEEYKEKLEENKLQNRMQKENSDYAHFAPVKGTQTQNVEYSRTIPLELRKKLEAAAEASEMPFEEYLKMYNQSQKDIKTLAQQGR